jgi:hypothetical protein
MRYQAIVGIALSTFALFGSCGTALAQADCKTLVKASPFGPDDQTGATNRITPAVTKAAAAEIQSGAVISMAYDLVDGVPLFGTRFTKTILTAFAMVPGAEYGKNKLTYMEDTYLSQSHVGTHIDGMGHIGVMDCYYNQTPMGKFVTQNYLKKLGLEHVKSFATRGVIIDMVKVFQEAGKLKSNAACRTPSPCVKVMPSSCIPVGETSSGNSRLRTPTTTRPSRASASLLQTGSPARKWCRSGPIRGPLR